MYSRLKIAALAICFMGCLAGSSSMIAAQDQTPAADNTKVNKKDRAKTEPTADQGSNKLSDRELMQKIRRSVLDDKSLSTYAHNVKIVARDGKVTLKGPVRSEDEKQAIEQKAAEIAGAGNVTNEITIKTARSAKAKAS